MGAFAVHMFSAGVYLLAGYLIYKWLLSDDNQPGFNRVVLLLIYAISFVLPFWHFGLPVALRSSTAVDIGVPAVRVLESGADGAPGRIAALLLWAYLAGAVAAALVTMATLVRLCVIVAGGARVRMGNGILVTVDDNCRAPFSWGRYIVVNRAEEPEVMNMIVSHECAHIRYGHFYDLLLAQAVCALQWYNPAAWLMLSELKAVHEYQADNAVIASGVNMHQYQLLLIKKTVGIRFQSFANSLNHSNLKKRITMMYKSKSKPARRLRVLAAVPAAALAMALLNVPVLSRAMTEVSSTTLGASADKVSEFDSKRQTVAQQPREVEDANGQGAKPDVLPECVGGLQALYHALAKEVKYPDEAYKNKIEGRVVVGFTVTSNGRMTDFKLLQGVSPSLDAEALRAAKALNVTWKPALSNGKPVNCSFAFPVDFKLE